MRLGLRSLFVIAKLGGIEGKSFGGTMIILFKSAISATLPAVAFAALVVTSPIAAQPAPQGRGPGMMEPGPSGQMPGGMMGSGTSMPMMGMMADHVEGRIAFLKTELKITDSQTPQWNAFADALRANAQRMSAMRNTMMQGGMMQGGMMSGASVTAPDRLDRMEKMMTAMSEAVKVTKAALAPLYAVLTDEQKKIADQLIHGPMGMGRM
jgi:LTXXQ motif family protein